MVQLKKLIRPAFIGIDVPEVTTSSISSDDTSLGTENPSELFSFSAVWTPHTHISHVDKFIKNCFLSVISVCIDKLTMLKNVFATAAEEHQISDLSYRTIEERFGFEHSNMGDVRLNTVYTDLHKLQKDVGVMIYLLKSIIDEAKISDSFDNVNTYMSNLDSMYEDEEKLIQELRDKSDQVVFLRLAIVKERAESFNLMNSYNESIQEATRYYYDEEAYSREEVNFTRKWQNARHEQNTIKLKSMENNYSNTTKNMKVEIDLEKRCHEELESFLTESHKDYMNDIQYWMDTYEADMEFKESEIFNLKMDLEKLNDQKEALQSEYEERTQAMEDWRAYKRKKKEEAEQLMLENWAASTIQAWWREVMIRRKLGPYGKKGKKNKKGKKGKKK